MKKILIILLISSKVKSQTVANGCYYRENLSFTGSCYETYYDDYALILYDTFDNDSLNYDVWSHTWRTANGTCSDETKTYFNRRANVTTSNGKLNLWLKNEPATLPCNPLDPNSPTHNFTYSGGWINSIMQYGYGKFEISFKVTNINYTNPAFWLYGFCQNEIDIFEFFEYDTNLNNRKIQQTLHSSGGDCDRSSRCSLGTDYIIGSSNNFSDNFHTATVEWTPNHILWKIDGIETKRLTSFFNSLTGTPWECSTSAPTTLYRLLSYPNYDMFQNLPDPFWGSMDIILDIGQFGNGTPNTLPALLEVDYVKAWAPILCNETKNLNGTFYNPSIDLGKNDVVAGNIVCSAGNNGMVVLDQIHSWKINRLNLVASNEISFLPGFECQEGVYMSASISPCDYDKNNRQTNTNDTIHDISNLDILKVNKKKNYLAFPNPTSNMFNITNLEDFIGSSLDVYSSLGVKLFTLNISSGKEIIDLTNYTNGLYVIKIKNFEYPISISKNG